MREAEILQTDLLIIGGGIAGICAAVEAHDAGADVILANKGQLGMDGAAVWMAGWGFQVALYPPDSLDQHIEDTIRGGKYLNNQKLVKAFLSLAPKALEDLEKWGMRLAKKDNKFQHARLPGQTYARSIHHVHFGKMLGTEYRKVLPRQIRKRKGIKVLEDFLVFDLLKNDQEIVGAVGLNIQQGTLLFINAKATILATGGYMGCYNFTTANSTATGDGHAAAYRAGVRMTGMEFVQFIPTAAIWPEIVRGDLFTYSMLNMVYGIFLNKMGERFMERYFPVEKDWATREAASRAIAKEVREGRGSPHGGAYLSFKHIPNNLMERFLNENKESSFLQNLKKIGFDITQEALEVGPAAHYVQGGCWIDETCKTNLQRLYAIGEVGSGGKDGADRLAGNSLPFCMAMGYVAGRDAVIEAKIGKLPDLDQDQIRDLQNKFESLFDRNGEVTAHDLKSRIRNILSIHAIFERTAEGLNTAVKEIEDIREKQIPNLCVRDGSRRFSLDLIENLEAENMVDVAEMVVKSALMREESRGLHERADFPKESEEWLKHLILWKGMDEMLFTSKPVTFPYVNPK